MRWCEASTAVLGMLAVAMPQARAGREEGLAACHAGEWKTAARELLPEEGTTRDAAVVRCLADIYFGGMNVPRDPQRAFGLWKRLADLGNDEAQDMVGYFYLDGVGTDRDPRKAEQMFLRSAAQGNQNAMSELSLYYSLGFIGSRPDQQKAMYWTIRLASSGNLQAQVELVRAYSRGEVVQRDDKQAVRWALQAAEQDSEEAYLFLGYATKQGRGTERNLVEAYKWFGIAAAHTKAAEAAEAVRRRDEIAAQLTAAELQQAQRLALQWWIRPRSP
jgi:TPR repeat protein